MYLCSRHLNRKSCSEDEVGNASEDDVILLYLDWCLIT